MTLYVLFFDNNTSWMRHFCKSGYNHCCLLVKGGLGWYWIKPTFSTIEFEEILVSINDDITKKLSLVDSLTEVIGIELTKYPKEPKIQFPLFYGCAAVVKKFMQVELGFVITPFQLRNKLLKHQYNANYKIVYRKEF